MSGKKLRTTLVETQRMVRAVLGEKWNVKFENDHGLDGNDDFPGWRAYARHEAGDGILGHNSTFDPSPIVALQALQAAPKGFDTEALHGKKRKSA